MLAIPFTSQKCESETEEEETQSTSLISTIKKEEEDPSDKLYTSQALNVTTAHGEDNKGDVKPREYAPNRS